MPSVPWERLGDDLLDDLLDAGSLHDDLDGRYELGVRLGSGGQGTVYRATDRILGRDVAVKCLHGRTGDLAAEAGLLTGLAHPAIPQIYDRCTLADGGMAIVMQLIEGRRLDRWLKDAKPTIPQRLRVFRAVAGAVAHAHSHNVLHRDLKPGNILVNPDGQAYLVDWGLAAQTDQRAICGSPYFAAPEQLEGQPADVRADVYSLGVLLYYVLSNQLPYHREVSGFQEFRQVRAGLQRVPLTRRVPGLDSRLERICRRAMAAQPAARYADVRALLEDLDRFDSGNALAGDLELPVARLLRAALVLVMLGGAFWGGMATVSSPDKDERRQRIGHLDEPADPWRGVRAPPALEQIQVRWPTLPGLEEGVAPSSQRSPEAVQGSDDEAVSTHAQWRPPLQMPTALDDPPPVISFAGEPLTGGIFFTVEQRPLVVPVVADTAAANATEPIGWPVPEPDARADTTTGDGSFTDSIFGWPSAASLLDPSDTDSTIPFEPGGARP